MCAGTGRRPEPRLPRGGWRQAAAAAAAAAAPCPRLDVNWAPPPPRRPGRRCLCCMGWPISSSGSWKGWSRRVQGGRGAMRLAAPRGTRRAMPSPARARCPPLPAPPVPCAGGWPHEQAAPPQRVPVPGGVPGPPLHHHGASGRWPPAFLYTVCACFYHLRSPARHPCARAYCPPGRPPLSMAGPGA